MKSEIYYKNLLKDRKHVLFLIRRDSPILASKLRNGRTITRLSTKQLVARVRRINILQSTRTHEYVGFLNSMAVN